MNPYRWASLISKAKTLKEIEEIHKELGNDDTLSLDERVKIAGLCFDKKAFFNNLKDFRAYLKEIK